MSPFADLQSHGPPLPDVLAAAAAGGSLLAACQQQAAAPRMPEGPLQELFDTVAAALEAERALGHPISSVLQPADSVQRLDASVRAAVKKYFEAAHTDFWRLVRFSDEHYLRHLIDENGDCEMMLICWKKGQGSRVHNHATSHCWLTCLSGGVEELRYTTGDSPVDAEPTLAPRLPGVIQATTPCPLLTPHGVNKVAPGATAYINDTMGLHAVRCDDGACDPEEEGCVSLHIYAPPIRRVRLYEPEADRVTVRAPGFNTIRGLAEEQLQQASHLSSSL